MPPRSLTPQQETELCALYERGEKVGVIRAAYGISHSTLHAILDRGGTKKRPKPTVSPYSADTERVVCARYQAGENTPSIAKAMGMNRATVGRILARNGLKTRAPADTARKYACDLRFFDKIETEAQAYWLGFLAADGYNTGQGVVVGIQRTDKDHLYRLKDALRSEHPVHDFDYISPATGREKEGARFYVGSPHLAASLARHGVVKNKSHTLRWPDFLEPSLLRHYLRGYFDGDGGISLRNGYKAKGWYPTPEFHVTSNRTFLLGCQRYLMERCDLSLTKLKDCKNADPNIATLRYSGRLQVGRIARHLYNDATVYLPRKRERVAHLL